MMCRRRGLPGLGEERLEMGRFLRMKRDRDERRGFEGKKVLRSGTLLPRSRGLSLPYPGDGPCDLGQVRLGWSRVRPKMLMDLGSDKVEV